MTKKIFSRELLFLFIAAIFAINTIEAKLTQDNFSDIRAHHDASFKDDILACEERIAEEMCDGQMNTAPTPEAILKFIDAIQKYINKIKDTQNISDQTVHIARIAILDAAKARKMLTLRTSAEILMDIEHGIKNVDRKVLELEKYVKEQSKK
jgi:hypothetical protein